MSSTVCLVLILFVNLSTSFLIDSFKRNQNDQELSSSAESQSIERRAGFDDEDPLHVILGNSAAARPRYNRWNKPNDNEINKRFLSSIGIGSPYPSVKRDETSSSRQTKFLSSIGAGAYPVKSSSRQTKFLSSIGAGAYPVKKSSSTEEQTRSMPPAVQKPTRFLQSIGAGSYPVVKKDKQTKKWLQAIGASGSYPVAKKSDISRRFLSAIGLSPAEYSSSSNNDIFDRPYSSSSSYNHYETPADSSDDDYYYPQSYIWVECEENEPGCVELDEDEIVISARPR